MKQENEKIEKIAFKKNNESNTNNTNNNSFDILYKAKSVNDTFEENENMKLNEKVLDEIEKTIGYDKNYIFDCLRKNVINYATATYYLLTREDEMNSYN